MRGVRPLLVLSIALLALILMILSECRYPISPAPAAVPVIVAPAPLAPEPPAITGVGVATEGNPWTIWVAGTNFSPDDTLFARLTDTNGAPWTTVFAAQTPSYGRGLVRFSLPSNVPPSGCDRGRPCTLSLTLFDATTGLGSAPVALTLPDPL